MRTQEYQEAAKSIVNYYRDHKNDRLKTVNHFKDQGMNPRIIRNVIKSWNDQKIDYVSKLDNLPNLSVGKFGVCDIKPALFTCTCFIYFKLKTLSPL